MKIRRFVHQAWLSHPASKPNTHAGAICCKRVIVVDRCGRPLRLALFLTAPMAGRHRVEQFVTKAGRSRWVIDPYPGNETRKSRSAKALHRASEPLRPPKEKSCAASLVMFLVLWTFSGLKARDMTVLAHIAGLQPFKPPCGVHNGLLRCAADRLVEEF